MVSTLLQRFRNSANELEFRFEAPKVGPCLVRHGVDTTSWDLVYLAAHMQNAPEPRTLPVRRRHLRQIFRGWKLAVISAAAFGMLVALIVMMGMEKNRPGELQRNSVLAPLPMVARSANTAGQTSEQPKAQEAGTASPTTSQQVAVGDPSREDLLARNRRLEILVKVLRQRNKTKSSPSRAGQATDQ